MQYLADVAYAFINRLKGPREIVPLNQRLHIAIIVVCYKIDAGRYADYSSLRVFCICAGYEFNSLSAHYAYCIGFKCYARSGIFIGSVSYFSLFKF